MAISSITRRRGIRPRMFERIWTPSETFNVTYIVPRWAHSVSIGGIGAGAPASLSILNNISGGGGSAIYLNNFLVTPGAQIQISKSGVNTTVTGLGSISSQGTICVIQGANGATRGTASSNKTHTKYRGGNGATQLTTVLNRGGGSAASFYSDGAAGNNSRGGTSARNSLNQNYNPTAYGGPGSNIRGGPIFAPVPTNNNGTDFGGGGGFSGGNAGAGGNGIIRIFVQSAPNQFRFPDRVDFEY